MEAYDIQKGDAVHPGDPVVVDRYTPGARVNHWITATCLVLLALSGLALFYPGFFFLTALFGGGQWTRAIHPWIGVVLFFSFSGLFLRFWKANLWRAEDGTWLARLRDVLTNNEERLPEVGKYNAGQKVVFWSMTILIIILICTGIVIWDEYFYPLTSVVQKRYAIFVGHNDYLRVDRSCLRRHLGTRHHWRHDPRPSHWRLGLAASPQMA
jgi:formate dehydrogenase subunit gamma